MLLTRIGRCFGTQHSHPLRHNHRTRYRAEERRPVDGTYCGTMEVLLRENMGPCNLSCQHASAESKKPCSVMDESSAVGGIVQSYDAPPGPMPDHQPCSTASNLVTVKIGCAKQARCVLAAENLVLHLASTVDWRRPTALAVLVPSDRVALSLMCRGTSLGPPLANRPRSPEPGSSTSTDFQHEYKAHAALHPRPASCHTILPFHPKSILPTLPAALQSQTSYYTHTYTCPPSPAT